MRNLIVYSAFFLIAATGMILFSDVNIIWGQESEEELVVSKGKAGRNLQVLTMDSPSELQNYMKTIMKSLGVDCKFCHKLTDFVADVDTLHKDKAREMITMVNEINTKFFKDSEIKITCFTCHRGHKEPVMTFEEWDKVLKAEKVSQ